ncbi:MAG: hypothetical protein OER21_10035 [Gemmatimonadota bacterium]|nr:hypothetical protein [Gemmatimonadota bacterium]
MIGRAGLVGALTVALLSPLEGAWAQESLDSVVVRARAAWLEHRVRDLVAGSDTVRLRIPGVAVSAAVRPSQAARLLGEYLEAAEEQEFAGHGIRYVAEDHAYAEFGRRYAVRGTADVRQETVFFGFRRIAGAWRLREVRVAP